MEQCVHGHVQRSTFAGDGNALHFVYLQVQCNGLWISREILRQKQIQIFNMKRRILESETAAYFCSNIFYIDTSVRNVAFEFVFFWGGRGVTSCQLFVWWVCISLVLGKHTAQNARKVSERSSPTVLHQAAPPRNKDHTRYRKKQSIRRLGAGSLPWGSRELKNKVLQEDFILFALAADCEQRGLFFPLRCLLFVR